MEMIVNFYRAGPPPSALEVDTRHGWSKHRQCNGHADEGHAAESHASEGHTAKGRAAKGQAADGHAAKGNATEGHAAERNAITGLSVVAVSAIGVSTVQVVTIKNHIFRTDVVEVNAIQDDTVTTNVIPLITIEDDQEDDGLEINTINRLSFEVDTLEVFEKRNEILEVEIDLTWSQNLPKIPAAICLDPTPSPVILPTPRYH